MARYINQKLLSFNATKLKGITNLNDLNFTPHSVTAILGANCIGKSSLLHAIASCYQPEEIEKSENHKISEYLKPNPHALWQGTKFKIEFEFEDRANQGVIQKESKEFCKNSDRWSPRYDRRPFRNVFYVGIHTTLPILEYINFIKYKSTHGSQRIRYETRELTDDISRLVREKASYIFNRDYTKIYQHKVQKWSEDLYGLSCNDKIYSQISMGAGEQRVLKILSTVFNAPPSSIILIDEIDLLLHEYAFQRIIEVIVKRANDKRIQIIFTTHRETVLKQSNIINIRYLYKCNEETKILEQLTPDALTNLTGILNKSITIYVEDLLSSRIIKKISQMLKISRHVKTIEFGAAKNCFAITAGSVISNPEKSILTVIDGDQFVTVDAKNNELNKVITGSSPNARKYRKQALERIFQYNLPEGISPEEYIKKAITNLDRTQITDEYLEIYDALSSINAVLDRHNYVDSITNFYDDSPEIVVKDVVHLFSKTPEWDHFSGGISLELKRLSEKLCLNENSGEAA